MKILLTPFVRALYISALSSSLALADDRELLKAAELIKKGCAELQQSHYDAAVDSLTIALQVAPTTDVRQMVLFYRAVAYGGKQREDAARADLDTLLDSRPPQTLAAKALGLRAMINVRACKPETGLADVESAVEMDPLNPEAYRLRGLVQLRFFGNYAAAMADFDRAVELAHQLSGAEFTNQLATAYAERGDKRLKLEQYGLALSDFEAALKLGPKMEAYTGRALVRLAQGSYGPAQEDAEMARRMSPTDRDLAEALGLIAFCQGDLATTKTFFSQTKKPLLDAILAFSQGERETAMAELRRLTSDSPCAWEALEAYGMFLFANGQTVEAYQALRRAVEAQRIPNLSWAVFQLASEQVNGAGNSVRKLNEICDQYPKDVWANQLIALASGKRRLEDILKEMPVADVGIHRQHEGEAYYVAGERELKQGNKALAMKYFQDASKRCRHCSLGSILANHRLDSKEVRSQLR